MGCVVGAVVGVGDSGEALGVGVVGVGVVVCAALLWVGVGSGVGVLALHPVSARAVMVRGAAMRAMSFMGVLGVRVDGVLRG